MMRTHLSATMLLVSAGLMASGCATTQHDARIAEAHYQAQMESRKPACRLIAEPGQQLVIQGLAELECWGHTTRVAAWQPTHHPAWSILSDGLRIGLPIYLGGRAAVGLAETVGTHAGHRIGGSVVGGHQIGGAVVGGDQVGGAQIHGPYTGGDTIGRDTVGRDTVGRDRAGGSIVGGDQPAGDLVGDHYTGGDRTPPPDHE